MAPAPAVRPSAIAGTWYPGHAETLRHAVAEMMDEARPANLPGAVLALVCPHAGYRYSGPTAAHAYRAVRGETYTRVIILGPLHRPIAGSRLGAVMVPAEDAYVTPLGQVRIDRSFLAALGAAVPLTEVRHDQEHSLEIQLPFLQVALAAPFNLAPIMLGEYIGDPGTAVRLDQLSAALARLIQAGAATGERTLLLASTDLSHLDNYADVVRTDGELVDLVNRFDLPALTQALATERVMACGATGLVATLSTAQRLGAEGARVLAYASSGDVTGNKLPGAYTVGYLAAAAYA
ncbi:MAG TPA: AmmeMemoRadiSam system protein B [Anaerolineae bacterium]